MSTVVSGRSLAHFKKRPYCSFLLCGFVMRKLSRSGLIILIFGMFFVGCEKTPPEVIGNSLSTSAISSAGSVSQITELTQPNKNTKSTTVYFDFDSPELTLEATQELDQAVKHLQLNLSKVMIDEGHADERGTREYSLVLGAKRTSSVSDFLVTNGIDALRIRQVSFGKEQPTEIGSNAAAWSKNMRAVIVK